MAKTQYTRLDGSEEKLEELYDGIYPDGGKQMGWTTATYARASQFWTIRPILSFVLATLLSSIVLSTVFVRIRDNLIAPSSYETGFRTDMALPFKVPMVEVRAHGSPIFPAPKVLEMPPFVEGLPFPENVSYVGNPGPVEDHSWAVLIKKTSFPITLEEARRAWPDNYQEYYLEEEGTYRATMDVHHALHCLDIMRKLSQPATYRRAIQPHVNHCLEYLRQQVMCYGSTTLIPAKWTPEISEVYIDANQIRTCRDYSSLHAYMSARRNPENALYVGAQPRE